MSKNQNRSSIPLGSINWGDLRNLQPVSERWGFDRGKPIDRYYIEGFLETHQHDIRGRCIEVLNDNYTRRFGGENVLHRDILDINEKNSKATILGDLTQSDTLPTNHYDCFILTQTLPVIYDTRAALANSFKALKPGGVLLITVPALCRYSPHPEDYWRFTKASLESLINEATESREYSMESYGNLIASIAFLTGIVAEELSTEELEHFDRRFPVVIMARVVR